MEYGYNKKSLSFSAIDLWLRSKAMYRKQYYSKEKPPMIETPELLFGRKIAQLLERNNLQNATVPRYEIPEKYLKTEIDGIVLRCFIDSFNPVSHSFLEYKTGRIPWTQKRVDNHLQLPFYALMINEVYDTFNPICYLVWLETKKTAITVPKGLSNMGRFNEEISLTGNIHVFKKIIIESELIDTRVLINKVAKDIAEDYLQYSGE